MVMLYSDSDILQLHEFLQGDISKEHFQLLSCKIPVHIARADLAMIQTFISKNNAVTIWPLDVICHS